MYISGGVNVGDDLIAECGHRGVEEETHLGL